MRMLKDFGSDALPIDGHRTYDASQSKTVSQATWRHINAAAATVTLKCSKKRTPVGGWMEVNDETAVLMLPSRSLMRLYWANDLVVSRLQLRNGTDGLHDVNHFDLE